MGLLGARVVMALGDLPVDYASIEVRFCLLLGGRFR